MPLRLHAGLLLRLGDSLKQPRRLVPSAAVYAPQLGDNCPLLLRTFSNNYYNNNNKKANHPTPKFRPQRRPDRRYRPIVPPFIKVKGPRPDDELENPVHEIMDLDTLNDDSLSDVEQFGPQAAEALEYLSKLRDKRASSMMDIDSQLRMADYFTADHGSTEDLVGERRGLAADIKNPAERKRFLEDLEKVIDQERFADLDINEDDYEDVEEDELEITDEDRAQGIENRRDKKLKLAAEELASGIDDDDDDEDFDEEEEEEDESLLVKGPWAAQLIRVDYVQKPQRGGRKGSYRALAIGGNGNGCGGFGLGKADTMERAVAKAIRKTKRNPIFVERFRGRFLTRDLVGKHNSCLVKIRATDGLKGNELVQSILIHCGVVGGTCKAYYTRTQYNVVIATFKALLSHESMEEYSHKRGARLITIERARRLQV